ncbi:MAG: nuclear transport factor 2 family protein [Pseudomonadota bacterium]
MTRYFVTSLAALCALAACTTSTSFWAPSTGSTIRFDADEVEIRAVLAAQAISWNRGDIDGFMEGYWRDPDLRFASGGTVTRGWQSTLMRYQSNYKDKAAMGLLSFSALEVNQVSDDAAIVHGAWSLEREGTDPSGLFTLVFRDFGDGWVITSDTTTRAEQDLS